MALALPAIEVAGFIGTQIGNAVKTAVISQIANASKGFIEKEIEAAATSVLGPKDVASIKQAGGDLSDVLNGAMTPDQFVQRGTIFDTSNKPMTQDQTNIALSYPAGYGPGEYGSIKDEQQIVGPTGLVEPKSSMDAKDATVEATKINGPDPISVTEGTIDVSSITFDSKGTFGSVNIPVGDIESGATITAIEHSMPELEGPTTSGAMTKTQIYNAIKPQISGAFGDLPASEIHTVVVKYKDHTGIGPKSKDVIMNENTKEITDPYKYGLDLGRYISLTQIELNNGLSEKDASELVVSRHPELAYLTAVVKEYSDRAPRPNVNYEEISQIYNGQGITPENVFFEIDKITNEVHFSMYDETGVKKTYKGAKGSIPPIHGIWCGPYSYNDRKPIDLLDTYAFLHDIDYDENGYFHLEGDLKFLSRINQNLDKMDYMTRLKAQQISKYFATIGYSLSVFKNGLPADVDVQPYSDEVSDIYDALTSDKDAERRRRFYKGLRTGTEQQHIQSNTSVGNCSYGISPIALDLFDSIPIVEFSR